MVLILLRVAQHRPSHGRARGDGDCGMMAQPHDDFADSDPSLASLLWAWLLEWL